MDALMEYRYVGWRSVTVASRYVGNSIRVAAERNEAFARHGLHPGGRFATVGGVRKTVRGVRTGQPTVEEPLKGWTCSLGRMREERNLHEG